jgi:hypothetical protein
LCWSPESCGQQRYEPSRPTVSPYVNLFRENNGIVPNYQSLVRPMLQQQQTNIYQGQQLKKQQQSLRDLQVSQQDLERRARAGTSMSPTGKGAWFNKPGSQSTFMNTSGFYSQSGTSSRVR